MSKARTSEELTAAANELQAKLNAMRREARKMKRLEEQQEAEAKRQADIAFALDFVALAKKERFQNGTTFYDALMQRKANAERKDEHQESLKETPRWGVANSFVQS